MKTWTKKQIVSVAVGFGILGLINACTMNEPLSHNQDTIEKALQDGLKTNRALKYSNKNLPPSIQKALMPDININIPNMDKESKTAGIEPRFDIAVNNIPAKDFFMGLVKDTKYNITISPQINGNVSLKLKAVTIPQVMNAVRDAYGFEYEQTSYGFTVFPTHLETKIFKVNYIDIDRSGQSQTTIGSGQITNTVQNTLTSSGVSTNQQTGSVPSGTINTTSNAKFWDILKQNLETIIGTQEGRSITVNPRAGTIIVRAYPYELRYVTQYLDNIQNIINRQVIIEAKVLGIQLSAAFQSGINWTLLGLQQGEIQASPDTSNSIATTYADTITGVLNVKAKYHSGSVFSSVIRLLNNQGKVSVLSSPHIATINNQKAVIKVGTDRFFVTNVTSNTNNYTSGTTAQTTSSVTLTPFFSGISLDVTPQIDENDYVTMHIHPIVSLVTLDRQQFTVNGQGQDLPLAKSEVKETDSVVRAKSGQVIVIGGLMESGLNNISTSTPGVDRIPGIGGLFKSQSKSAQKNELVVLLRPIVVKNTATWQKQLQEITNNIKKMRSDFSYNIEPIKQKNESTNNEPIKKRSTLK